jgi:hypothetical protein
MLVRFGSVQKIALARGGEIARVQGFSNQVARKMRGDFLTQLARDVLKCTRLSDLQTLFADEMQVSNSPLGCPTEVSPLMIPALPASQTWEEWLRTAAW